MINVLNINDNNLLLQLAQTHHRSQGYAWLKNGEVYFDFDDENNAVAACRLEPQQINSRYWQQCEQTALASNGSGMRHAADLIWRHLSEMRDRFNLEELVLVVPSHYQPANLQLLLGIAKSCGLQISGLLNKAVLGVSTTNFDSGPVLHIDVQLHQTVCSEVHSHEGLWQLGKIEILHEVGLHTMQDALLRAAQDRFIQSDRFDPLHYAETEQQLFDQLPRLAQEIQDEGKANMIVMQADNRHSCSIDERQWMAALQPFADELETVTIEAAPQMRCYDFNGFQAFSFRQETHKVIEQGLWQPEQLNPAGLLDDAGKVIYQAELPAIAATPVKSSRQPAAAATAVESPAAQATNGADRHATHLLQSGVAIPIGRARISIVDNALDVAAGNESNLAQMLKSDQLFILGSDERSELRVNDRLGSNLADGVITVIRVE